MHSKPILSLIGCGWLGRHLISTLTPYFTLQATTQSAQSAQTLPIPTHIYDWRKDPLPTPLISSHYTLIAIPPSAGGYSHYPQHTARLAKQLRSLPTNRLTFLISSTSAYPDDAGHYDENSAADPQSPIYQAEQQLLNTLPNSLILRCGGLFGDNRLSGSKYYGQTSEITDKPLNLIHHQDIANAILALYQHPPTLPQTYNLVHPEHPNRHHYYQAQAKLRQQPLPQFINKTKEPKRLIHAQKITQHTPFTYQHPPTQST